jgi:hypothetical protein
VAFQLISCDVANIVATTRTRRVATGQSDDLLTRVVGGVAMLGSLLGSGLRGIGLGAVVVAVVVLVLGLVALIRCRKEDIPAIVRAMASWWGRQ